MTKGDAAILEAYRRGFRVTDDGVLLNPAGRPAGGLIDRGYKRSSLIPIPGYPTKGRFSIHRLAAYQWFGMSIFQPGVMVRHLNGNSLDNCRANIAIGSNSDNMMDRTPEARKAHARLAASHLRSLTVGQAQQLIDDRAAGMKYKDLMKKYGIAKSTVSYIVNGKVYPELKRPTRA